MIENEVNKVEKERFSWKKYFSWFLLLCILEVVIHHIYAPLDFNESNLSFSAKFAFSAVTYLGIFLISVIITTATASVFYLAKSKVSRSPFIDYSTQALFWGFIISILLIYGNNYADKNVSNDFKPPKHVSVGSTVNKKIPFKTEDLNEELIEIIEKSIRDLTVSQIKSKLVGLNKDISRVSFDSSSYITSIFENKVGVVRINAVFDNNLDETIRNIFIVTSINGFYAQINCSSFGKIAIDKNEGACADEIIKVFQYQR